jgi:hypothetical protein
MSQNKKTVGTYLDGFRKNDHAQLTGAVPRETGDVMRMSMAEVHGGSA